MPPDEEPFPEALAEPAPIPFDWDTAHLMTQRNGWEQALVYGLSMISTQLDYLIRRTNDG